MREVCGAIIQGSHQAYVSKPVFVVGEGAWDGGKLNLSVLPRTFKIDRSVPLGLER